ncbi:MAG: hypothetical protein LJF30_12585 [Acidobacteria bacterium]|nr:hypothetical protein [Acidobacteriota bacterium]
MHPSVARRRAAVIVAHPDDETLWCGGFILLLGLLKDAGLRRRLGEAGRRRAVERFDYRTVARRFVELASDRLGIH